MERGETRRELLARGAKAGTAGVAAAAGITLAAPAGAGASAGKHARRSRGKRARPVSQSELDRLVRLMSVEQLMLFCYDSILDSRVSGPRMHRALDPLRVQEQAHVQALGHLLSVHGASAPAPPSSPAVANQRLAHRKVGGRLGQLKGAKDGLRLLLNLEQVVVGAYFVALTELEDPRLILLAIQIMANDAQHESMINLQLNPHDDAAGAPYGLVQGLQ
jgi:hypothetical protein